MSFEHHIDTVITALEADNDGLDEALEALKVDLTAAGTKEIVFNKPLPLNNREGKKRFQAYAKKFGISVKYS